MRFAHPHLLWLLLVFPPAMAAFFWWSWRTRQRLLTQFIQARLLPALTVGISPARQKLRAAGFVLAVAFLILALARPQWGFDWEETKQRGLDIVVAIDTSKSMLAEDIAPNRLTRAKLAALDLMQQAKSDRLGLVAFAGSAFLQCPLTIDDAAFRQSVDALDVNTIPQGGTTLAEAIDTALTAFKEGDNYKTLVLITDGEDHDSGALEAAQRATASGLQIFTVGIGSAEGELLRMKDGKGRTDYIRDEQGNVVKSHLNEELLKDIARSTRGAYFLLRGAKTMETLYKEVLAPLPKSESQAKLIRIYHEQFQWPLAIAILLLIAEMLLPERKHESSRRGLSFSGNGAKRGNTRTAVAAGSQPAERNTAPEREIAEALPRS
jgi:Ca-activated chloride channel family protein